MRAQKSFLNRIFGIFVRQYDGPRYGVRPSLMLPDKPGKTPIVARLGKANELPFLIRNTAVGVGLLGQTRFSRALVQSYRSLTPRVVGIEAGQIDS